MLRIVTIKYDIKERERERESKRERVGVYGSWGKRVIVGKRE